MQKIKLSIIQKMIKQKVTSAELDFILYISRFQDDKGNIIGIYYKDIMSALDISHQKFYDLKSSLCNKGIIKVLKEDKTDWNIEILNNDFSNLESLKEGYINTNQDIFYNKKFFALKSSEKLLAMEFMKITFAGKGSYNILVQNFFKKYTELFGVSKRVIQNYLCSLKEFFSIGVKDRQYWITPLVKIYRKSGAASEADNYKKHIGQVICRREKIQDINEKQIKESVDLITQYQNGIEDILDLFITAVKRSIEKANKGIKNSRNWTRKLQPKLIHKLLREQIYTPII